jgi:CHASE domain
MVFSRRPPKDGSSISRKRGKKSCNDEDAPVVESMEVRDLEAHKDSVQRRNGSSPGVHGEGIDERGTSRVSNLEEVNGPNPATTIASGLPTDAHVNGAALAFHNDGGAATKDPKFGLPFQRRSPPLLRRRRVHSVSSSGDPDDSSVRTMHSRGSDGGGGAHFNCLTFGLLLILLIGMSASATILWVGISTMHQASMDDFYHNLEKITLGLHQYMTDSLLLGMWTNEACRAAHESSTDPRGTFARFWRYVEASPIDFDRVACVLNVTREEREDFENATRAHLALVEEREEQQAGLERNVSSTYLGFHTLKPDPITGNMVGARESEKPFYFPMHYAEPMDAPTVRQCLDLDAYSILPETIETAMFTGMPTSSGRHFVTQLYNKTRDCPRYGVTLFHPGIRDGDVDANRFLSSVTVTVVDGLKRAYREMNLSVHKISILLYDSTSGAASNWATPVGPPIGPPVFLGGAILHQDGIVRLENTSLECIQEISMDEALRSHHHHGSGSFQSIQKLSYATREWTILVMQDHADDHGHSDLAFICLGAALIMLGTVCLCVLIYANARRIRHLSIVKAEVEAEKAAMNLKIARKAAEQERELNDYIAHEVSCRSGLQV